MKTWFIKTLLSAIAIYFLAWLLPGIQLDGSYLYLILVAAVIGFLNNKLKPLLVLLTLPATIITLGLFMWIINAGLVLFAGFLLDGFTVSGFWWALIFSALLSIINSILFKSFLPESEKRTTMFSQKKDYQENIHTTQTGNKVANENGKKTIIIEKSK